MSNRLIDIVDITKSYGDSVILDQLNLYIRENEFLTLLGPSGCGKTTLLRILGGFETPDSGKIIFDGKNINDIPPNRRQLNTVFQKYALFSHMTIADNIAFGLKIKGKSKSYIDDKIHYALKLVNLEGYQNRYPDSLSGGQQQRIAIARAIVNEPKVLLLDEPLGALDLKLRQDMQYELIRLKNELGITFIYVTHDQTEAMTLGTRIVVMKDGVVQQVDTPENLYDKPGNKFVAGFIGAPQMNMVDAEVKEDAEGVHLVFCGQSIKMDEKRAAILKEKGYIGKKVTLGIRPEDLHDESDSERGNKDACLNATIRVYEMLGAETFLYFDMDTATWTARVNPSVRVKPGEAIKLYMDTEKIHAFDTETENAIFN